MTLIRKFAIQGHPVPNGYTVPRGPFPPEIYAQTRVRYGTEEYGDSLHEALDDIRLFRCKECGDILYEEQLNNHICESEE
jgi:hypothetical protein